MSGATFVNGSVFTMGNASGDTKWSTNLQIDSLNAYSIVLEQTSGPGTGGQLSYDGAHLLLNGVPVEGGGGGGGTSESNSFGSWTYRVDSAAGSCGFFSGSIRLGKTPSNTEGVLFLSSLNAAITNNSSAQVVISQGDVYARITLTSLNPATYYYSYTCTVPPISFTVGQPVSLYFYNPSPFLQGPGVVIPAASGSSTLSLVGSNDSLITLGGHGTTFTVGVVDGTDTLKVGPVDINKNSFGTPFIYQNVATSGSLVLGSSRGAPDIIEISDTSGNASVSVSLSNGTINMGSLPNTVELAGNPPPTGSFLIQNGSNENISLTASSTINSLVVGTAGLTSNSLVFTVGATTTSIVQDISSGGIISIGSSQLQPNTLQVGEAGLNGFVSIGGRGPGGNVFIAGGSTAGVICIDTLSGNEALYIGANGYAPNWESIALTSGNMKVNVPLTVASTVAVNNWGASGVTLSIATNATLSEITSSGTSGSAGGQLNLGTQASGGAIVITDNLITLNKDIVGPAANAGYIHVASSNGGCALQIAAASGLDNVCGINPFVASGGFLGLGSSQANPSAILITDGAITINVPIQGQYTIGPSYLQQGGQPIGTLWLGGGLIANPANEGLYSIAIFTTATDGYSRAACASTIGYYYVNSSSQSIWIGASGTAIYNDSAFGYVARFNNRTNTSDTYPYLTYENLQNTPIYGMYYIVTQLSGPNAVYRNSPS